MRECCSGREDWAGEMSRAGQLAWQVDVEWRVHWSSLEVVVGPWQQARWRGKKKKRLGPAENNNAGRDAASEHFGSASFIHLG